MNIKHIRLPFITWLSRKYDSTYLIIMRMVIIPTTFSTTLKNGIKLRAMNHTNTLRHTLQQDLFNTINGIILMHNEISHSNLSVP